MIEIKTKNMKVVVNKEENYIVIHCGTTSITYPLDEMRDVFKGV